MIQGSWVARQAKEVHVWDRVTVEDDAAEWGCIDTRQQYSSSGIEITLVAEVDVGCEVF